MHDFLYNSKIPCFSTKQRSSVEKRGIFENGKNHGTVKFFTYFFLFLPFNIDVVGKMQNLIFLTWFVSFNSLISMKCQVSWRISHFSKNYKIQIGWRISMDCKIFQLRLICFPILIEGLIMFWLNFVSRVNFYFK